MGEAQDRIWNSDIFSTGLQSGGVPIKIDQSRQGKLRGDEVRITDPITGGQKGVKLQRFDLIPAREWLLVVENGTLRPDELIRELDRWWAGHPQPGHVGCLIDLANFCLDALGSRGAEYLACVYGMGAQKYDDNNWRKGYKWGLSYRALCTHMDLHDRGQYLDDESGLPHLAHVLWHCLTLIHFVTNKVGTDDRVKL